jgi:tripartite-type tricarboxylate transporter receptor subunit TctC
MSQLTRRSLAAGLLLPALARAEAAYPERPVSLIVPFSAGGAADIAGRTLAANAGRYLPNPQAGLVVENRTGASGAVGTGYVARAKPDGQTLLLARIGSSAILPATDPRTPYAWDEFTMLGLLDENPFVVCVRGDAPWRTLGELAGALREGPGRLNFATTGPATLLDLGARPSTGRTISRRRWRGARSRSWHDPRRWWRARCTSPMPIRGVPLRSLPRAISRRSRASRWR